LSIPNNNTGALVEVVGEQHRAPRMPAGGHQQQQQQLERLAGGAGAVDALEARL
jgi:hypothetical protein